MQIFDLNKLTNIEYLYNSFTLDKLVYCCRLFSIKYSTAHLFQDYSKKIYLSRTVCDYCNKNSRKIKNILYQQKVLHNLPKNNILVQIPNEITKLIFYYINELYIGEVQEELDNYITQFQENPFLLPRTYRDDIMKTNFFWQFISFEKSSYKFLKVYEDKLDWNIICQKHPLTEKQIKKHYNKIQWDELIQNKHMNVKIFEKYQNNFSGCMYQISLHLAELLGEDFFMNNYNEFVFKIDLLTKLSYNFSLEFIEKYQDQLDWDKISTSRILNEEFVQKFQNQLNFAIILENNSTFTKIKDKCLCDKIEKMNIFDYLRNCGFWENPKMYMQENDILKISKLYNIIQNDSVLRNKAEYKLFIIEAFEKKYNY